MALYDPNEFPETKVEADFTLADVLAWARTKPADRSYNYLDPERCAVAQFGRDTGRRELINLPSDEIDEKCPGLADAVHPLGSRDWSYGALARRLEAALAQ